MSLETVGRPMDILLVEDSLTFARLTINALKKGGIQHRLTWLRDGEEAMEFVCQEGKYTRAPRPDLILLDLGLPRKDGREVLSELKQSPTLKTIPVVILTASNDSDDITRSQNLNVEGYLTKPVDLQKFLALIQDLNRFWHADMIVPSAVDSEG